MLRHLSKLIWNKKKQNFLLMLEIFVSFLGLFVGFTAILYPYNNYKLPLGFEDENVWAINATPAYEIKDRDSLMLFRETIKRSLLAMENVGAVSYSGSNIPFSGNSSNTEVGFEGERTFSNVYSVEDSYLDVLGMKVLEGRWFAQADQVSNFRPVVIDETLKTKLFGTTPAIGKILDSDDAVRMKVIGVVNSSKFESEEEAYAPGLFLRIDTGNISDHANLVIKVKRDEGADYEGTVHKTLSNQMRGADIEITRLTDMKDARHKTLMTAMIVATIIAGFLIINVALGIFGVLWYNINKRKSEIGLRRALGATGMQISSQLVAEALLIASLALLLGVFFAIQLPLLNVGDLPASNYYTAIVLSILSIYGLVILCALYPGGQAAKIYPAIALHEN